MPEAFWRGRNYGWVNACRIHFNDGRCCKENEFAIAQGEEGWFPFFVKLASQKQVLALLSLVTWYCK